MTHETSLALIQLNLSSPLSDVKVSSTPHANGVAVCFEGTAEDVERAANLLYNMGASGKLKGVETIRNKTTDQDVTFGYVLSETDKLINGIANYMAVKAEMNDAQIAENDCREYAKMLVEALPRERFMHDGSKAGEAFACHASL